MTDEKKAYVTMDVVALERLIPRHAYVGDLALAENLSNYIEWLKAEVDHWKGAAKQHAEAQAAAVEAFHDATRLRSQIQQARINAENERDEARAELYRAQAVLTDDTALAEWEKRGVVDAAVIAKLREARAEVERLRKALESMVDCCPGHLCSESLPCGNCQTAIEAIQEAKEPSRDLCSM